MNNRIDILGKLTQGVGFTALIGVIACGTILSLIKQMMEKTGALPPDSLSLTVAGCLILLAFYHVLSVIVLVIHQKTVSHQRGFRSVLLAWGIISFLLNVSDTTLLQEIGHELDNARAEWTLLTINFSLHLGYVSLSLVLISLAKKVQKRMDNLPKISKNDAVFATVNYLGAFSGCVGLAFLAVTMGLISGGIDTALVTVPLFSLIIIAPYLLVLVLWGIERIRAKSLWDDEMQSFIIRKASSTAALTTGIMGALIYSFQLRNPESVTFPVIWFPLLVFSFLTVFSMQVPAFYSRNFHRKK